MSASDNYYILLECFLDPPDLDWSKLKARIGTKRAEWNRKRNNPDGIIYQRLGERVDEMTNALKDPNVRVRQAEEARGIRLAELDARIGACSADGSVTPEQIRLLLEAFSPFFSEKTIRSRIKVPETADVAPPPPPKRVEDPNAARFLPKMKQTSTCLLVLGKETVYDALGLSTSASLDQLRRASEELGEKGQRASRKTAETNAQKELGGLAKEFFRDESSKRAFDAARARFQISEKLIRNYEFRIVQRKEGTRTEKSVTLVNYDISVNEAVKEGMSREEAEWFVYEFYVLKRKCADPRVFQPEKKSKKDARSRRGIKFSRIVFFPFFIPAFWKGLGNVLKKTFSAFWSFFAAVNFKTGFFTALPVWLGRFANFNGRARVGEFLCSSVWFAFFAPVVFFIAGTSDWATIPCLVVEIFLTIAILSVFFRRLHDTGLSSRWLIPFFLMLFIALMASLDSGDPDADVDYRWTARWLLGAGLYLTIICCVPTQKGSNEYGAEPPRWGVFRRF